MKEDIEKTVEIPENFNVEVKGNTVSIKGNNNEIKKKFNLNKIKISKEKDILRISSKKATRRESKLIGTITAHLKNIIEGLKENFVYKLEICNVHFPMNVKLEGGKVVISSFLGETKERTAKILPNVIVKINEKEITVSSFDKEAAGQTAANIEKATKVKGRDRRIFQDGIFITEKCGRAI
jgi:large subunit ribosomal protein L6